MKGIGKSSTVQGTLTVVRSSLVVSKLPGNSDKKKDSAMKMSGKEFASSSNGDRWLLARDDMDGAGYVIHEANKPSGGAVTRIEIGDFLKSSPAASEHLALLSLIGAVAAHGPSTLKDEHIGMKMLRRASEDDADKALFGAKVALPLTTSYEALEFFNCMLDVLSGQRESDEAADALRMPVGFGSTH